MSIYRSLKFRIEYILTLFLSLIARIVPYKVSLKIADVLGDIFNYVLKKRREVTLDNLRRSFPDMSEKKINKICRDVYRNASRTIMDFARLPAFTGESILELVHVHDIHLIKEAHQEGKGILIVAGHFGSWEVMGITFPHLGFPTSFLVGEQKNRAVDSLINNYRAHHNVEIIRMGVAARGVIKALKANRCVAFLSDQDAGKDGVIVDFFGRKASTPGGAAIFALKTGAPFIMAFPVRSEKGDIDLYLERIDCSDLPEEKERAIKEITQRYTSVLEKYVRKYPDHWFWMHRRWKSTGS